jgi:hypothetical protein
MRSLLALAALILMSLPVSAQSVLRNIGPPQFGGLSPTQNTDGVLALEARPFPAYKDGFFSREGDSSPPTSMDGDTDTYAETNPDASDLKGSGPLIEDRGTLFFLDRWRAMNPVVGNPTGTIKLLTNEDLKISSIDPHSEPTNLQTLMKRPIDRFEVEPDVAIETITKKYNTPADKPDVVALLSPDVMRKARGCGDAVRQLRHPVPDGFGEDLIDGFDRQCLSRTNSSTVGSADAKQLKRAAYCGEVYDAYVKQCFAGPTELDINSIYAATGIIYAYDPAHPKDIAILCSGTLVDTWKVATSRHCLEPLREAGAIRSKLAFVGWSGGAKQTNITGGWLYPNSGQVKYLAIDELADQVGRILDRGVTTDVVVLGLEEEQANRISLAEPLLYEHVVLAGFQRLIANAIKLRALLAGEAIPSDYDLLTTGSWKKAFRADQSPVCLTMQYQPADQRKYSLDDRVVGHFCQSLAGASGSGIFSLSSSRGQPALVAIHSRRLYDSDLAAGATIESVRPSNAAVAIHKAVRDMVDNAMP